MSDSPTPPADPPEPPFAGLDNLVPNDQQAFPQHRSASGSRGHSSLRHIQHMP